MGEWKSINLKASGEWSPYSGNPILSPTGDEDLTAWGSVWKDGDTYHYYYSYNNAANYHRIGHATSSNGTTWTKDTSNNPILVADVAWEGNDVWDGSVWKEGSTWYMLYTGHRTTCKIGLATASNPEGPWAKDNSNPVMSGAGGWETNVENMQCMKIGSTYYLWYNILGGTRKTGLATSTDLVNWTKDANNPIFSEALGVFQPCPFKYGSYYYLLIMAYTSGTDYSDIRLYRDTNPTFYSADRELVKIAKSCSASGWDSHDQDTPCVLSENINRDSFVNNQLWTYYAGESGGVWKTGLLIETDISSALTTKWKELERESGTGWKALLWEVLAVDVGAACIDRPESFLAGYTGITKTNPAEVNSTITDVCLYLATASSDSYVGIFYLVSGNTYKCRSAANTGSLLPGANNISSLSLDIQIGDVIGAYLSTGKLEKSLSTGSGTLYLSGNKCVVDDETEYSTSTSELSIYGNN